MGLLDRALKKGWPIGPELKALIMDRAQAYLADPCIDPKIQAAWAKLVVLAESQNLAARLKREEYRRLDQGKLTANQGHTLILDGPIRPQIPSKAIPSLTLNENAAEGQPGGRDAQLAREAPPALPPLP